MSNFSNLISEIQSEIQYQANESSLEKCLKRHKAANIKNRKATRNFFKQSHALQKSLRPSKSEIRQANRQKIQRIRQSIKDAILTKSMTSLETIKLENAANTLQAKLYQKGLI